MRSQEKHAAFSKNRCGIKRKRLIIIRLSTAFSTQTRGRTGMEVNPLVFETSASTDSAIWAFATTFVSQMRCKGRYFF